MKVEDTNGAAADAHSGFAPESWDVALNYSGLLGVVPSSFSSVIRSLLIDHGRNNKSLSPSTRFMIERLVKSRSLKASLYFGALTFQPERIEGAKYLGERQLVDLYTPGELAVIVGISYLFKRARKLCDPAQFAMITNRFQESADIGAYIGYAIPGISPMVGIVSGSMPFLGLAPFLFYDRRGFVDYIRHLKKCKLNLDAEYEANRWGCTSVQIASVMLQALGLGVATATAFSVGLSSNSDQLVNQTQDAIKYKTALIWLKAMEETGKEPDIVHRAELYPTKAAMEKLGMQVAELKEKGSSHCWFLRGAFDISQDTTPQLFSDGSKETTASTQIDLAASEIQEASRVVSEIEADIKEVLEE